MFFGVGGGWSVHDLHISVVRSLGVGGSNPLADESREGEKKICTLVFPPNEMMEFEEKSLFFLLVAAQTVERQIKGSMLWPKSFISEEN